MVRVNISTKQILFIKEKAATTISKLGEAHVEGIIFNHAENCENLCLGFRIKTNNEAEWLALHHGID